MMLMNVKKKKNNNPPPKTKTTNKPKNPKRTKKTQAKFVLSIPLPTNYSKDQNVWLADIVVIII